MVREREKTHNQADWPHFFFPGLTFNSWPLTSSEPLILPSNHTVFSLFHSPTSLSDNKMLSSQTSNAFFHSPFCPQLMTLLRKTKAIRISRNYHHIHSQWSATNCAFLLVLNEQLSVLFSLANPFSSALAPIPPKKLKDVSSSNSPPFFYIINNSLSLADTDFFLTKYVTICNLRKCWL